MTVPPSPRDTDWISRAYSRRRAAATRWPVRHPGSRSARANTPATRRHRSREQAGIDLVHLDRSTVEVAAGGIHERPTHAIERDRDGPARVVRIVGVE